MKAEPPLLVKPQPQPQRQQWPGQRTTLGLRYGRTGPLEILMQCMPHGIGSLGPVPMQTGMHSNEWGWLHG